MDIVIQLAVYSVITEWLKRKLMVSNGDGGNPPSPLTIHHG